MSEERSPENRERIDSEKNPSPAVSSGTGWLAGASACRIGSVQARSGGHGGGLS